MAGAIPEGELPDDLAIKGPTRVLRRVPPGRYNLETGAPDSSTFDKDGDDPGTSVTLWLSDDDLRIVSEPHPDFGIVMIDVETLRAEELRIAFVHEDGNPNHCEVYGGRSKSKRRRLSSAAQWIKYPIDFPETLKAIAPLWKASDV